MNGTPYFDQFKGAVPTFLSLLSFYAKVFLAESLVEEPHLSPMYDREAKQSQDTL